MMVGHTHDDIDQMFSRFSNGLSRYFKPILSVPHFFTVLKNSYSPRPQFQFMYQCSDWKSWLDKYSAHSAGGQPLHGHTRPHQFRFLFEGLDTQPRVLWKKWAVDATWRPLNADTPPVYPLVLHVAYDTMEVKPLRTPDSDVTTSVFSCFSASARFVSPTEYTDQMQFLLGWMGATHVDTVRFQRMSLDFKWGLTPAEVEERNNMEEEGGDHLSRAGSASVARSDIETSDEDLIYQGKTLHSQTKGNIRYKGNFVDVSKIVPQQFLLVRGEGHGGTDEIWLCKVVSIGEEADDTPPALTVQWYGGSSIRHAQNPEVAADAGGGGGKRVSKNKVFYQEISLDTVLVSEVFNLTATKRVPVKSLKIAEARLSAWQAYKATVTQHGQVNEDSSSSSYGND